MFGQAGEYVGVVMAFQPLTAPSAFRDALRVYRLLFQRSVTTAAIIYGAQTLLEVGGHGRSALLGGVLRVLAALFFLIGPLLVQGALVEIVRNIHEGRAPDQIGTLFSISWGRVGPLFRASILYAVGVLLGLVLLIVPGLMIAARWSLMAPLVVLERQTAIAASKRSAALVKGNEWPVLGCVLALFLINDSMFLVLRFSSVSFGTQEFVTFVWSSLTAPLAAHLLTVIYYRLADRDRPVIDPAVSTWRSVWEGR